MRFRKKKEIECNHTMAELKERGISLFDLMIYHMKKDGYIDENGKVEYLSD